MFTPDDVGRMFAIWGLPPSGTSLVFYELSHRLAAFVPIWQTVYGTGDMTAVVSAINNQISVAGTNAVTVTQVEELLWDWKELGTNQYKITQSAQAAGVIADSDKQREWIRQQLANIIGVFVPANGFYEYTKTLFGSNPAKQVVESMGLGCGDR